jgi:lysyl-tRNA synthetase class II
MIRVSSAVHRFVIHGPQVRQKEQGDDEAQGIDETFVDA